MDQYRDFAFIYDELMDDVDYDRWVEYIEEISRVKVLRCRIFLS